MFFLNNSQILIYQSPYGNIITDVRLEEENVWLIQKLTCLHQTGRQVEELFQITVPNINRHLESIYEDGELEEKATIKNSLQLQKEVIT